MKICPFISHMIGEDRADILQIASSGDDGLGDDGDGVVILGYDGEDERGRAGAGTATARKKTTEPTHLFCLRDTCRFYRKAGGQCQFDVMYEAVEAQRKASDSDGKKSAKNTDDKALTRLSRDLDKVWKFQTKSVAELIESIGESDRRHGEAIEEMLRSLEKKLSSSGQADDAAMERLTESIDGLRNDVNSREEGFENLASTVSEIVLNVDERMEQIREQTERLAERVEQLSGSVDELAPMATLDERFAKVVDNAVEQAGAGRGTDDLEPLASRLGQLAESSTRVESRIEEWRTDLETHVGEIREQQAHSSEAIAELHARQDELLERLQAMHTSPSPKETGGEQRRKARRLNNLGVTSFHNGELELARDQFLEAVTFDDMFAECYNNLGLVYTELGDAEHATEAFERAIEINPDLHAAYNNLGYVFYRQGNYDQAIDMYNQVLGRTSDNASAYTNLGNAHYKLGRTQEARTAWEKALELDPANEQARRNLSQLQD